MSAHAANLPPTLKGWCPGALRPMPVGDGLLVRVHLNAGRLSLAAAATLAETAARLGNGVVEISSRANLQIRGVSEAGLGEVQDRLDDAGLMDSNAQRDPLGAIVASPMGDLDPTAWLDVAPLAQALEARLAAADDLAELPPKFSFCLDDGGAFGLAEVRADIRFVALAGEVFEVTLSGEQTYAAQCAGKDLPEIGAKFARVCLHARPPFRRMQELLAAVGAAAIFTAAGLTAFARGGSRTKATTFVRDPQRSDGARLGLFALGDAHCLAVAPVLGRMQAAQLSDFASAARAAGASDLRLTPWRSLIATRLAPHHAGPLAQQAQRLGFVVDANDPRLAIVACAGAPACVHAAREVQSEALALAPYFIGAARASLHVSGCQKGCAHAAMAPVTLIARAGGYDLIVNGRASAQPRRRELSLAQVRRFLASRAAAEPS